MYRLRTAPIPAYDTFPVQELQGYHTCHDEYLCHSEQASTRRKNIGNDIVSRYLMIDLEPLTKKAEIELLNKHPLAAPRKSVRSNGRSRASRVITKIHERNLCGPSVADVSENRCHMQEKSKVIPKQTFQLVESKDFKAVGSEDDDDLDEHRSELSATDFDFEDDLDDNDLMELDDICSSMQSIQTPNRISSVTIERSPARQQIPSALEDCNIATSAAQAVVANECSPIVSASDQDHHDTFFEEDLLTETDISDMDECCNLTPATSVFKSSAQTPSINQGTRPVIQQLQPSAADFDSSSTIPENESLKELDLSTINELPWDSALLPQPCAPIQRSPFPRAVSSHSPVVRLTSQTLLRTCFRIGEALNTGCNTARNNRHEILELFCRVSAS